MPQRGPRMSIAPDQNVPPIPCDDCGFNSLHVAHVLDPNGSVVSTVLVCTRCHARDQH